VNNEPEVYIGPMRAVVMGALLTGIGQAFPNAVVELDGEGIAIKLNVE
jgi:hypothetical protein